MPGLLNQCQNENPPFIEITHLYFILPTVKIFLNGFLLICWKPIFHPPPLLSSGRRRGKDIIIISQCLQQADTCQMWYCLELQAWIGNNLFGDRHKIQDKWKWLPIHDTLLPSRGFRIQNPSSTDAGMMAWSNKDRNANDMEGISLEKVILDTKRAM